MGFIFSYLMCFFLPFFIQRRYNRKKVRTNIAYSAYAGAAVLITFWIFDFLTIFGLLDGVLINLNNLPGVNIPQENTGLYYYYNCGLMGFINFGIPVQNNLGFLFLAGIIASTYISIYKNGQGFGKFLYGKRANQTGAMFILRPLKKPDNWREMEAKWIADAPKREANKELIEKYINEGLELAENLGLKDHIKGFRR